MLNVDVDVQWLQYGSVTDFREWSSTAVDLKLLLVRLSDLDMAHPELSKSDEKVPEDGFSNAIKQFMCDLEQYDVLAAKTANSPLVVQLCPSVATFAVVEREMQKKMEMLRNVTVLSSGQLLSLFQQQYSTEFYDAVADKRLHSPYTQDMLNVLSFSLCRQICRLFRSANSRKKVLVLDCDNTLWGGAVAEVGPSGIDLGPRFLKLQQFVVAQQKRGMLLALCSKNILEDVAEAFTQRRNDMVLDMDKHIVAAKVNWQPKSENIAQLAHELSLGLDSFVFIDDNPLECNEVASALPSVAVISLGADFPESILDHKWVFDEGFIAPTSAANTSTQEDVQRTKLYQQNAQRERLRESISTHKAFLSALGVKIVFEELDRDKELEERGSSFTRTLQLHHRTNQFNTATTFAKRLGEEELLQYVVAPDHTVICAHVTDRFGHYGLVSVALCQHVRDDNTLRVDSVLLSCRALNRGVEHAMIRRLSEVAARTGAESLVFSWEPTERNQPALAFFSALSDAVFTVTGGKEEQQLCASSTGTWVIPVDKARKVSFLKSEENAHSSNVKLRGMVHWLLQVTSAHWLQDRIASVVQWVLSSFSFSRWIATLFRLPITQQIGDGSVGLLRVSFRDHGSLEHFLAPVLRDVATAKAVALANADSKDSNADDKFRRKARHQTKLALVNHLHEETPHVVWSANRPHADTQTPVGGKSSLEAVSNNETGPPIRLQLVCETPQCSTAVQRDSQCAFQRCRNCCYKIQRLLARYFHHTNADARLSALNILQGDFALDTSVAPVNDGVSGPDKQWCVTHQNKRRRGEIFKAKDSPAKEARRSSGNA
ncbi:hypothetical protein P3T76_014414 [Phytophthora citrophthora]|uniref:N-acetyltransferase domain-containing protein n=1 Tax=Phytophthora citrophthora TaxID=4793 RepID=A0AAD9G184_9STRA|nr:hypothetical protein P3T76_014414 [Phytophthora citrophthora]